MNEHRKPRGHSNCYPEETAIYSGAGFPLALIPLAGGSSIRAWKAYPPLALGKGDWETIGRTMGWLA